MIPVLLFAALAFSARAEIPPQHADAAGDALPPGALARLGTVRFRHHDMIQHLTFSADSKRMLTSSSDMTACLWEVATGRRLHTLQGHNGFVCQGAISKDGKLIATASQDQSVRLWNAGTGAFLRTIKARPTEFCAVAISPDGTRVATGSKDNIVRLWEQVGSQLCALSLHSGFVTSLSFAPDGSRLASCGVDGRIGIWDVQGEALLFEFPAHKGKAFSVAFSPDGKFVASGGNDKTVSVVELASRTRVAVRKLNAPVVSVAFSADGSLVAAATGGSVVLFNAADLAPRSTIALNAAAACVAFSPDGKLLATCDSGNAVRFWNPETGTEVTPLSGHTGAVSGVAFSNDGQTLYTAARDGTLRWWSSTTGAAILAKDLREPLADMRVDPAGAALACTSEAGTVFLLGAGDGANLGVHKLNDLGPHRIATFDAKGVLGRGTDDDAAAAADIFWRGKGDRLELSEGLISCFPTTGSLVTRDGTSLKLLQSLQPQRAAAISPGGRYFAVAGTIITLTDTHGKQKPLELHHASVRSLAFSPDGRVLASGDEYRQIRLWETLTGAELLVLDGHRGAVTALAFSPRHSTLLSGSEDTTALLWDLAILPEGGAKNLDEAEFKRLWNDLAAGAPEAHRAAWRLVRHSDAALPRLRAALLKSLTPREETQIAELIVLLDDDDFNVRQRASAELFDVADIAAAHLKFTLLQNPSAEVRKRISDILRKRDSDVLVPEDHRRLRAHGVLEQIGSAGAIDILTSLRERRGDKEAISLDLTETLLRMGVNAAKKQRQE